MSAFPFPHLARKTTGMGHIGFDHVLLWPTAELNALAEEFDMESHRSLFPEAEEIISRVNNGTTGMGGKRFAMKHLLPEQHQKPRQGHGDWTIPGLTPCSGEMDHEQQIKMRQTRPDKTRGWMAPAAVISHTYASPDRAVAALMRSYAGAQVIHLKDQISWYYPERSR